MGKLPALGGVELQGRVLHVIRMRTDPGFVGVFPTEVCRRGANDCPGFVIIRILNS